MCARFEMFAEREREIEGEDPLEMLKTLEHVPVESLWNMQRVSELVCEMNGEREKEKERGKATKVALKRNVDIQAKSSDKAAGG